MSQAAEATDKGNPQTRLDNGRIFPYFAAGGGWESTISLINLFENGIDYTLRFRGANGQPASVTYRNRDNQIVSGTQIEGRLDDDASHTFVLIDTGLLQTGWAEIDYSGESRIGGILTFRQRVSGRPDFESSVSLIRNDETRVYFPYDNTLNFATSIAMTNPSTSDTTNLRLRFWNASGDEILTREINLSPATTVAFSLRQQYPELANTSGQLRIEGTGNRLSTIALRFNPQGAFSTVPVVTR